MIDAFEMYIFQLQVSGCCVSIFTVCRNIQCYSHHQLCFINAIIPIREPMTSSKLNALLFSCTVDLVHARLFKRLILIILCFDVSEQVRYAMVTSYNYDSTAVRRPFDCL